MSKVPLFGSAAILAGGKSSRMGFDKQLLTVNQRNLIDITISRLQPVFDDIIIVTTTPDLYQDKPVTAVKDNYAHMGPLAGIEAALRICKSEYLFVLACDMPNFNESYALRMQHILKLNALNDACITRHGDWIEPFHGYYGKSSLGQLESDLSAQKGSIYYFLKAVKTLYLDERIAGEYDQRLEMFSNLNTRCEYEAYLQKILG